jgi:hypothetical protein
MTFDERVQAVAKKGFTERQARFLTTVMLHTGVCVPRQYARFCGIVYGAKTRKFFAKLVRLNYASIYDCRHNRSRIYHLNQRALYAIIFESDSRLRRPVTLNHAIQRLMVLDAIVEDPDLVWLGTADEKAAHVLALTRIAETDLPHVAVPEGDQRRVRYFPDRLPIGIHLAGRGVLVYVVTDPWLDEFRVFLERHAALLRALRAWTLRIVVPPQFPDIAQRSKQVVWNQLLTPLRTETIDELRWYFEQVRAHPTPSRSDDLDERLYEAREAFCAPRFKALYKVWKQDGERVLTGAGSRAISDARNRLGPSRDPRTWSPLRSSLPSGCYCVTPFSRGMCSVSARRTVVLAWRGSTGPNDGECYSIDLAVWCLVTWIPKSVAIPRSRGTWVRTGCAFSNTRWHR